MKKKLSIIMLLVSMITIGQRSTAPWHNHVNYKQDVLQDITNTDIEIPRESNAVERGAKPVQNVNNRVTVGCQDLFLSGINVAWINYGMDVGVDPTSGQEVHPDMAEFEEVFDSAQAVGSNSIRWWMHINGSCSPQFGTDNYVSGINASLIDDTEKILDAAAERGMRVQICLWSFDMLKDQWGADASINKLLFSDDDALTAYIDNALIPMVKGLKGHPGLLAWEVFNEPEGMTEQFGSGWDGFLERATMAEIQKVVNRCAGAIHREDPDVIVTSSSWAMLAGADGGTGNKNYYTDSELIAAGGDQDGTLDIYNLHYYDWAGTERSPFHHDAAYWGFDKPTVIAEFHPEETFGVANKDLSTTLYNSGYAGALDWSWTDVTWQEMKEPLELIHDLAASDIDIDFFACDDNTTARFTLFESRACQGVSPEFANITEGAESYSWDFGADATPATYDGMTPPAITYSSAGVKTISLSINGGGDMISKEFEVVSSTSSYEAVVTGDVSSACASAMPIEFLVELSPELSLTPSVLGVPGKSDWDDGAEQTVFELAVDGTIPEFEKASQFLLGNWHTWSSSELVFNGLFGSEAKLIFNVPEVSTEYANPVVEVLIDGVSALNYELTVPVELQVDIPSGSHSITVRNAGDEWLRIDEYEFTNLGADLVFEWYKNGDLMNELDQSTASIQVVEGDKISAVVNTGDLEECVSPNVESNIVVVSCVTGNDEISSGGVTVFPNPFKQSVTVEASGSLSYQIVDATGITVLNGVLQESTTIDFTGLASGVYFLEVTSGGNVSRSTLFKE